METIQTEKPTGMDASTTDGAADRIASLMAGELSVDVPPSDQEETPTSEVSAEPAEESEAASEPTEETTGESITTFSELAEHLGVEESFLETLIIPTKVNGEERKATVKDLIQTYQKGSSADLKLMDLAEQRKAFESEANHAKEALQNEWGRIQSLNAELQNLLSGDEESQLSELRHSDPAEYAARMAERQTRLERARRVQTEMQKTQSEKILNEYQHRVNSERNRLLQAIPEWQDDKTAERENVELRSYLKAQGLEDWEIDGKFENGMLIHPGIIDHRAIVMARKAMQFDASRKGSEGKAKKLKSLPKVGAGRPKGRTEVNMDKVRAQREKLKKSGSMDDAASAILSMIGE